MIIKILTNRQKRDIHILVDVYLYDKHDTIYLNILTLCRKLAFLRLLTHFKKLYMEPDGSLRGPYA